MKFTKVSLISLLACLLAFVGCSDDDPFKSSENKIIEFSINDKKATIETTAKTIDLSLPYGADISALKPVIKISDKATVNPASDVAVDFSSPVVYTVRAEDGSIQEYNVTVTVEKSAEAEVLTFEFADTNPKVVALVNEQYKTIYAEVPFGTDITKLKPTITYKGNTISPASGKITDFTSPVVYTVTAPNLTEVEYTVTIKVSATSDAELVSFTFADIYPVCTGVLNENTKIVTVDVPFGVDITKLKPSIIFKGHTISPASEVVQDFSEPQVFYTITAQDGEKYEFSVMVNVNPFEPKIISVNRTKFTNGDVIQINGSFSETGNEIMLRNSTNAPVYPTITKETSRYILATIPSLAGAGEYNMTVKSYVGTPSAGSVLYEEAKITIVDPETLRPKIVSMTPATIIRGTENKIFFKAENLTDLAGRYGTMNYVFGSTIRTTNILRAQDGPEGEFHIEIGTYLSVGTYQMYLERDGLKSNEMTFELKANPYPVPKIISVSTYTPVEGEAITIKGENFTKVSNYDSYIEVRKIVNEMGYNYPVGSVPVTVIDDNTLTFSLPFIEATAQNPESISGHVGIRLIVNGQVDHHSTYFTVKQK